MKLIRYQHQSRIAVGIVKEESVIPIPDFTMEDLIISGFAQAETAGSLAQTPIPLDQVTYLPPIGRPGKVIALGRNYAAHAKEGGAEPPKYPMLFHKTHTSLNAHNAPIVISSIVQKVDYEAELAVIIGTPCKNVSETDALNYVAGYTCANDVTARGLQRRTSQFTAGKMLDGFCPIGPVLVPATHIPEPQNLTIKTWHNGNLMQDSNTSWMIFSVAFTISYISQICTLEAGDIILTGTPEGVGYARTPPVYMQDGDTVSIEVESIGTLTNHFVKPT